MAEPPEGFITPPPGLLPDAPPGVREGTDSGTRKLTRPAPTFFVRPPGAPSGAPPPDQPPNAVSADLPTAIPTPPAATPPTGDPATSDTVLVSRAAPPPAAPPPAVAPPPTPVAVRWTLRSAAGIAHPVSPSGLIVGRDPRPPEGWEGAALLPLADPGKSVSKTHAALSVQDGELHVLDLSSTNGTTVAFPDGTERRVGPGTGTAVPSGSTIGFGGYPMLAIRS
ncbi:MAG: FHA domain-containing protein [Micrococcales bacterium]|nr:FHA domain-containing protein [Micrococcales bacterium]